MLLCDSDGKIVTGKSEWCPRVPDAMMAESLACRESVLLAQGVSMLNLEIDCQDLINLWHSIEKQRSAVSLILHDIKLMSRSFIEFTFHFSHRSYHRVAHELAKQASQEYPRVEW